MSFLVMGSSNERPIRRLMAKNVRSGLVTLWRLAGWPTRRSPSSVNATMEGVVRAPSEFSMTLGAEPSITATQEFVVPRSMPITLPIVPTLIVAGPHGPEAAAPGGEAPRSPIEHFAVAPEAQAPKGTAPTPGDAAYIGSPILPCKARSR